MIKRLLSLVAIIISFNLLNAQTQLDNASFEEWEEIGLGPNIIEPVEWSSIKSTADPDINNSAPHVWDRSVFGNAHTGNYSVYLHTVKAFGIVATGTITNGRYHAEFNINNAYSYTDTLSTHSQWHTKISARPDSLVGWYKANPSVGDFPTVKTVLHTGYAQMSAISDTLTYVASGVISLSSQPVTEWTRFSIPLNYYSDEMPEFALVLLTSSNGYTAVEYSEAWFDDIEYIYNNGTGLIEKNSDELDVYAYNNTLSVFIKTQQPERFSLKIYDMLGKLIQENSGYTGQQNFYEMNFSHGVFVVSVQYNGKTLTKKIIQ